MWIFVCAQMRTKASPKSKSSSDQGGNSDDSSSDSDGSSSDSSDSKDTAPKTKKVAGSIESKIYSAFLFECRRPSAKER